MLNDVIYDDVAKIASLGLVYAYKYGRLKVIFGLACIGLAGAATGLVAQRKEIDKLKDELNKEKNFREA